MNIRSGIWKKHLRLGATAMAGLALLTLLARAQTVTFLKSASGVKYPDYYDPPNQTKLRTLVTGDAAVPEGKTRVRIKNLHIESFRESGELEAVVDAPDCLYDHSTRMASSAGPLQARSADGKLKMEGLGFSLSLTNQSLYISNNFKISMRQLKLAPQKP